MKIDYAQVGTQEQELSLPVDALREAGIPFQKLWDRI